MRYRRFGKTEIPISVISCGGMRYQESWKDTDPITLKSQRNVEDCIRRALECGVNHIETARGYGTSEYQLGQILPNLPRDEFIFQTKVSAKKDVQEFVADFEKSISLLNLDYIDFLALHGINGRKDYELIMPCLDRVQQWKEQGRIRHIGFSTHAPTDIILKTIQTDAFAYVNLHWYYIFQENWPAIEEARKRDMGVFIISPNDKGGMLYKPTKKLLDLCSPLHPMVFNGLFCLSHLEVHTLSCGVARPEDFDIHMVTVQGLDRAKEYTEPIQKRLDAAYVEALGERWAKCWRVGLPRWEETPGRINIPVILHLWNLARAYNMIEYGKMRYNLLGHGDSWFPGEKAHGLGPLDLSKCLENAPCAEEIPDVLAEADALFEAGERKRLQADV